MNPIVSLVDVSYLFVYFCVLYVSFCVLNRIFIDKMPLADMDGSGFLIDYPAAIALLDTKDSNEMRKLLENNADLDKFIQTLPQIKTLSNQKEKLIRETKSLAESNLSRKPLLCNDRNILYNKKKEVTEIVENIKRARIRLIASFGSHNLDLLYSLLQVASMEAEEKSSRVADRCFENEKLDDKEIEEFIGSFVSIRKEFYLRSIKVEKCEERLGIKSRKQSVITTKKSSLSSPRSKSSSPKRRAPQPPTMNSTRLTTHPSRALTPARKAPPPPRSKSSSPCRSRMEKKEL